MKIDLSKYASDYDHGPFLKRIAWLLTSIIFFEIKFPLPSSFKVKLLNLFGAKVESSVVIKPNVKVKYPWLLSIGQNSWIGEGVWIDNLAFVNIGANCCLSQSSYLLTGNHNYKDPHFSLITGGIIISDQAWVGSKAIVCPNVTLGHSAVLAVGSVATIDLDNNSIYQGNPAVFKKKRF